MDCEIPIGARFSILHRSFRRRIDELIGEQGLTGVQGFVLCELHRMEMAGLEEINQRDLERATHLSHPTLNEIIKRLELPREHARPALEMHRLRADGRRGVPLHGQP